MGLAVVAHVNVRSWTCGADIAQHILAVSNALGTVVKGAGANDANCVGVTIQEGDDGYPVEIAGAGSFAWVTAGAAVSYGDWLIIGDSSGRAITCPYASTTKYNIVGQAFGAASAAGEKFVMHVLPHIYYSA